MEPRERALGPATTRFSDYVGTVEADDAEAVLGRPSLYELANIDRDRYTIVGMDLVVDDSTTATVYAFDRLERSVAGLDEIIELGTSDGTDEAGLHDAILSLELDHGGRRGLIVDVMVGILGGEAEPL